VDRKPPRHPRKDGNHLPGYGWIFPVGDGTVNVGVGLLSTFMGWKSINTSRLMDAFSDAAPGHPPRDRDPRRRAAPPPTGSSVELARPDVRRRGDRPDR
jgi:flavin-dependent dehydrogenase